MNVGRKLGLVVAVAVVAGACASGGPTTLSARFVRAGTPTVDLGGPKPASMRPIDRNAILKEARANHVPTPAAPLFEASNPEVRAALAQQHQRLADRLRR